MSDKKATPKAGDFGKVNPKLEKALEKTPQGQLQKILKKAPRKAGSK